MQQLGLAAQLRVPALHHHPRQALAQLDALISELGRPVLVNNSLGGYYATIWRRRHGLPAVDQPRRAPAPAFRGLPGPAEERFNDEPSGINRRPCGGAGWDWTSPRCKIPRVIRCGCRPPMKPSITVMPRRITGAARCVSGRWQSWLSGFCQALFSGSPVFLAIWRISTFRSQLTNTRPHGPGVLALTTPMPSKSFRPRPGAQTPGMYTDTSRPNHLAQEVIDNSVDEALAGR